MDKNKKQKYSDMQKSAKEFAKSGAEVAKHAKTAMKTGANIAAAKIEDATGENGAKAIKQAKGKISTGVNAAAGKIEGVAARNNSVLLKKATSTRKKTVIIIASGMAVILLLIVGIGGIGGSRGQNTGGRDFSSKQNVQSYFETQYPDAIKINVGNAPKQIHYNGEATAFKGYNVQVVKSNGDVLYYYVGVDGSMYDYSGGANNLKRVS